MRAGGSHPNQARLDGFVAACLDRAAARAPGDRLVPLRRDADHVERQLRALSAWAAAPETRPPPPHLEGLTAFDLADALDRLNAAAVRAERQGPYP